MQNKPKTIRDKLKDKIINDFGKYFETDDKKEDRKQINILKE